MLKGLFEADDVRRGELRGKKQLEVLGNATEADTKS